MLKFLNMLLGSGRQQDHARDDGAVKRKYEYFKSLLIKNNRSLELLTELEHLLYENKPFTLDQVTTLSEDLISMVYDIAEDLNALSRGTHELPEMQTYLEDAWHDLGIDDADWSALCERVLSGDLSR